VTEAIVDAYSQRNQTSGGTSDVFLIEERTNGK